MSITRFIRLGEYLKTKREGRGLTQKEVADSLGYTTPQFFSNFERGLSAPPVAALKTLVGLYGLTEKELIEILMDEQEKFYRLKIFGAGKSRKTRL